ncbi:hypothetical protein [Martelella endophytica]|uniref:hypothetical protein n=1 Tax=Martelella endophytica TaxID=1486262 RepID=UPI000A5C03E2|nr:hypothetical protein [Martelella endophytica]
MAAHRNDPNFAGQTRSRNPIARFSRGVTDFFDTYNEVVAEARKRYPNSFK